MNNKPNIFDYATSELSQDAFLCWLMQWANKSNKKIDAPLNNCAVQFVKKLLNENIEIEEVEVYKQYRNIDVLAIINQKYCIIIEDKKNTKQHSEQLERYKKIAKEDFKGEGIKIYKGIYFKMIEESSTNEQEIKKAGYYHFKRDNMLNVLQNYFNKVNEEKQNNILSDYWSYLNQLEQDYLSFKELPLEEWSNESWQGFFSKLQEKIGDGGWGYTNTPSGGFQNFNWCWRWIEGKCEPYLQLEEEKLVFKLYAYKEKDRYKLRDSYRKFIYDNEAKFNLSFENHGRYAEWMSVAKLTSDYRVVNKENKLDFNATVENIEKATKLLNKIEKELKKEYPK